MEGLFKVIIIAIVIVFFICLACYDDGEKHVGTLGFYTEEFKEAMEE